MVSIADAARVLVPSAIPSPAKGPMCFVVVADPDPRIDYWDAGLPTQPSAAALAAVTQSQVDAANLAAANADSLAKYDAHDVERAALLVAVDEINLLREWIESFKSAVAAAASLAALKTAVAALPSMPDRTPTQARNAVSAKLGTMNGS